MTNESLSLKQKDQNTNQPLPVHSLIVQKYGGATLADPEKIKAVAKRVAEQAKINSLIVVVSAMGKTTNSLIELSNEVSRNPDRREMDMLLTVGERISMSLLSMALNDLGCPAISFTGSQAGILTSESHINAHIQDVRAFRVENALKSQKVVILAGFQGVTPTTKEITTLGRGGSDTSAVAMAAAFGAERCEILKDVPSIFTADPNVIASAKPIQYLNYDQLLDMTFWGAKVLHYRSVELAKVRDVTLYIGPASDKNSEGTIVKKGFNMFETSKPLSINSHEKVLKIFSKEKNTLEMLKQFQTALDLKQIAFPQLLLFETVGEHNEIILTGPSEILEALKRELVSHAVFSVDSTELSTVTVSCTGTTSPEISKTILTCLENCSVPVHKLSVNAMSVSALIDSANRKKAVQALHALI